MECSSNHSDTVRLFAIADAAQAQAFLEIPAAPWLCVQLRDRNASTRTLMDVASALRHRGHRICINDRIDVALAVGAEMVQLGHNSMTVADARRIAPTLCFGRSVHSVEQVRLAQEEGAHFCLLSPIFATPGKGPPVGVGMLQEAVRKNPQARIYALGGVTIENVKDCLSAGAIGVAAIRSAATLISCSSSWLASSQ